MANGIGGGKRVRVAIIGGGCAGIAAAWQLSKQPNYEIHVYEKSWRLGGKGASVRAPDGRILEHGLHVWLGFYENAFRMMRECYNEVAAQKWGPKAKDPGMKLIHDRFEDAFFPEPHAGVGQPNLNGDMDIWSAFFPPEKGLPGDRLDERTNPFTAANYLLRCFALLKTLMLSVIGRPEEEVPGEPRPDARSTSDEMKNLYFRTGAATSLRLVIERMTRLLRAGSLTGAAVWLQAFTMCEVWLQSLDFSPQAANSVVELMEAVTAQIRKFFHDVTLIDPKIRMKTELIDIVLTVVAGLFRDGVLFDERGLDSLNDYDYREWLLEHGATKTSVKSQFVRAMYHFVFAYRDGDIKRPAIAAGVALRGKLRMFLTYRGSIFWRIEAGMGDTVFAPLYKVLLLPNRKLERENGESQLASPVHFHFLHELDKVGLDVAPDGKRYVSSLTFRISGEQTALDKCSANALDESGCWPDNSAYRFAEVMKQGNRFRTLSRGEDFDGVILAAGVESFKAACVDSMRTGDRIASTVPPEWVRMCDEVKTVATRSAQVWLKKDLEGLGWYRGAGLFGLLDLPYDSWADMTQVLTSEGEWRAQRPKDALSKALVDKFNKLSGARSLAYFCGVIPQSKIDHARKKIPAAILNPLNEVAGELCGTKRGQPARGTDTRARANAAIMKIKSELKGSPIPERLQTSVANELNDLEKRLAAVPRSASARKELGDLLCGARARIEDIFLKNELERDASSDLTSMLTDKIRSIWPAAFKSGATAQEAEIDRHVEVNFEGSDRYTLSLPGSLIYRISPLDRQVENMTVAGDWTACGLDFGCVEAAVMSGMLAAYAISGEPDPKSIIGYDYP